MPAIVAFGRKWLVGSDDFVFPALVDLVVKSFWLIGALIVFLRNDPNFGCPDGDHFKIYLYGLLAMLIMLVLTDALVLKNSMMGSILDEEARVRVVPFIYIRCFFELLDIFWNILGTAWAYGDPFMLGCPQEPEALTFMKRFTVCNWISIVIMFLFFVALWDPLGYDLSSENDKKVRGDHFIDPIHGFSVNAKDIQGASGSGSSTSLHAQRAHYWSKKLKKLTCFCCNPSKDGTVLGAFEEAGRILSHMFRDSNYVTTDVLSGLLALYVRTQNEEEARRQAIKKRNSVSVTGQLQTELGVGTCVCRNNNNINSVLHPTIVAPITIQPKLQDIGQESPEVLASKEEIVLLDHYLRFIHGCYGWKAFLLKNLKKKGIPRLWSGIRCFSCFRPNLREGVKIKGDNCCLCATAALHQTARVEPTDIVYICFENGYFEPPFYVAVDHCTKSFVVAIRGTLTPKDMLTNFTAWPSPMELPGLPLHFKAHHGMMITARNVKAKLEKDKVLEKLQDQYPDYRVVLLGQSSGGAVATVLGMMMYYEYPSLHVYCYSPPGNILNREAAEFSQSFVTSVTYGDDVVARISIQSIINFKKRLHLAIQSCQTPKYRLMLGYARLFSKKKPLPKFEYFDQVPEVVVVVDEENNEYNKDNASSIISGRVYAPTINGGNGRNKYDHNPFYTPMFIPGKILHVTQRETWVEQPEAGPRWQLRWADKKDFHEVIISPRMIADHWYHRMEKGLHEFVIAYCREAFNALHHPSRTIRNQDGGGD